MQCGGPELHAPSLRHSAHTHVRATTEVAIELHGRRYRGHRQVLTPAEDVIIQNCVWVDKNRNDEAWTVGKGTFSYVLDRLRNCDCYQR